MEERRRKHNTLFSCLGEAIHQRRKSLGMSQEDLARESGVDRAFISNVERGKRNPSYGSVASIAEGLRMRMSKLALNCERCQKRYEKTA